MINPLNDEPAEYVSSNADRSGLRRRPEKRGDDGRLGAVNAGAMNLPDESNPGDEYARCMTWPPEGGGRNGIRDGEGRRCLYAKGTAILLLLLLTST